MIEGAMKIDLIALSKNEQGQVRGGVTGTGFTCCCSCDTEKKNSNANGLAALKATRKEQLEAVGF
jgi:hypothetical protein